MIAFTVPGPVRGKGRPRARVAGGFAQIYTDAKTRSYEGEVKFFAMQAMGGASPFEGPVTVTCTARFAPPKSVSRKKREAMLAGAERPTKKPDADNILKIADALNGVCFHDDAQVVLAVIQKIYAPTDGLDVVVAPVGRESAA